MQVNTLWIQISLFAHKIYFFPFSPYLLGYLYAFQEINALDLHKRDYRMNDKQISLLGFYFCEAHKKIYGLYMFCVYRQHTCQNSHIPLFLPQSKPNKYLFYLYISKMSLCYYPL